MERGYLYSVPQLKNNFMKLEEYLDLIIKLDLELVAETLGKYKLYRHVYPASTKFPFIPADFQGTAFGI